MPARLSRFFPLLRPGRAALIWSRNDILGVAEGGTAGCAATGTAKRVIAVTRNVFITPDNTSGDAGPIYLVRNLKVGTHFLFRVPALVQSTG